MWRGWDKGLPSADFRLPNANGDSIRKSALGNWRWQRSIDVPGAGDWQRGGDAEGQVAQRTEAVRGGAVECEVRRGDESAGVAGEHGEGDRGAGLRGGGRRPTRAGGAGEQRADDGPDQGAAGGRGDRGDRGFGGVWGEDILSGTGVVIGHLSFVICNAKAMQPGNDKGQMTKDQGP